MKIPGTNYRLYVCKACSNKYLMVSFEILEVESSNNLLKLV